eukprot:842037-Karenia_brevis.AAC.1
MKHNRVHCHCHTAYGEAFKGEQVQGTAMKAKKKESSTLCVRRCRIQKHRHQMILLKNTRFGAR